jgi:tryptophan synthase alpha chain
LQQQPVLLMTHIVIGYPSLSASLEVVDEMVGAGVDLIELQLPFSEPIADGKVILAANQQALSQGVRVDDCFEFAEKVTHKHSVPFLFMTYYNLLFARQVPRFVGDMRRVGIRGAIVPDLPPEEAGSYLESMSEAQLDPVFIFSPNTPPSRMRTIEKHGSGFIYCVARTGVTGAQTQFSEGLADYLKRCRGATRLPLAVGFGVKSRGDVEFVRDKADIAVVGSETLRVIDKHGVGGVRPFLRSLR